VVLMGATVGMARDVPQRAPLGNDIAGDFDENVSAGPPARAD
jgi:hypothetical protein